MPEGAARAALFTSPRAFGASLQTRAFTVVDLDLDGERIAHALRHGAEVLELCERPIQFVERASGRAEREAHAHPLHPHAVLPIAAHGEVHLAANGLGRQLELVQREQQAGAKAVADRDASGGFCAIKLARDAMSVCDYGYTYPAPLRSRYT